MRRPKFCVECGAAMVERGFPRGFDARTGAPRRPGKVLECEASKSHPSYDRFLWFWIPDAFD